MKAIVLCAGTGTRLRPLTDHWPKPAIPILGQPLFRFAIAELQRAAATAVGVNTHHRAKTMEAVAEAECRRAGLRLELVHEPQIQGTAGGIRGLRRLVEDDHFLVINGDILFPLDLRRIYRAHLDRGAFATMVLMPMPADEKYAAVEVDGDGGVRRIAGRGPGGEHLRPLHFTGVHVLSPAIFDFISPRGPEDINHDVYPRLLGRDLPIRAEVVEKDWSDLGTPARYLSTQLDLLAGRALNELSPSPFRGAERKSESDWRRAGTKVDGKIRGPVFFDADCQVESGALIGPEVYVGAGARVHSGARLHRTVVLEDAQIAGSEDLVDIVAWRHYRLAAGPPSAATSGGTGQGRT